MGISTAENMVN